MRKAVVVGCALAMLGLMGCAAYSPAPLMGFIYQEMKYPHPRVEVVNNGIGPSRGEAMAKCILGLVAIGDASLEAAMDDGNITRVYTVDHEATNILGVYATWKTIVTGE